MRSRDRTVRPAWAALALLLAAGALSATDSGAPPGLVPVSRAPETIRWPSPVGEVVFPHRLHAEDLGAECVSCHHGIVASNLEIPHPDYFEDFWVDCETCHSGGEREPAGADGADKLVCAACHPARARGPKVEMPTVKVAIHQSCATCHEPGRGAEASARCGFCHQRPAPSGATAAAAPASAPDRAEARRP